MSRPTAVVFAYHNVGVRLLKVLIDAGVEVKLVVSHADNPQETIWVASVARLAAQYGLPCITPDNADSMGNGTKILPAYVLGAAASLSCTA